MEDKFSCMKVTFWLTEKQLQALSGNQQLHQYLRTYIQPLMRAGKPLDLKDIIHHVNIRKPKLVQQLGKQQVQHMVQLLLDYNLDL